KSEGARGRAPSDASCWRAAVPGRRRPMSDAIIEINDSGVAVARDGRLVARSPGIAVVRQDGIELGESAARLAHTDPRNTYNRFWVDLSQDELPGARGQVRHHADLAFAHLKALHERAGKPERVIFAVPA